MWAQILLVLILHIYFLYFLLPSCISLQYQPDIGLWPIAMLWFSDNSISSHLSMNLDELEPFFSTLVIFLKCFTKGIKLCVQPWTHEWTHKIEGIIVILSFPDREFLSHTITRLFQYNYFKSWKLLFILQTKNIILQNHATPNVLFNLKKK